RYQERLAAYQAVDFDDLIGLPVALLQRHEQVRAKWQAALRHVLVDEYQDTNAQQYELLKLLVGDGHGGRDRPAMFTAVGDDDQSIYAFRGARVGNMADFVREYGVQHQIKLEENYRSHSHILDSANALI
ncbi:UvrD-helicase domain-containing protein, partial [Salmonella enterica]|uniref:UvrD-helicase domain-containing protein n=1 Tax=Salmonella enterica TaxID=28901 RepID=UPI003FA74540